jgi:putative methyltransferase
MTRHLRECTAYRICVFDNRKGFSRDLHVPDLLLFSPQTTFNNDPLYLSGRIILQDKASCFPAIVLSPPATDESVVIDATAAPGNKTSHLSALMENKGKVIPKKKKKKKFTNPLILSSSSCTPLNEIENASPPSK